MKKIINLFVFTASFSIVGYGQSNTGINTKSPESTLTVNGSVAADYKIVTASYTMGISDYFVAYNGAANGTLTLPAAINGTGNFKGRIYSIKNTSSMILTVAASGTERIDGAADVTTITIPAGYYLELISKGTTTGSTWELSMLVSGSIPEIISISPAPYAVPRNTSPTNTFNVSDLGYTIVPNSSNTFNLPVAKPIFLNFALGLDDLTPTNGVPPYFRCELFLDSNPTGLFLIVQQVGVGYQLQLNVSGVLNVPSGSHTIDARMIRWFNNGASSSYIQNFGTLSSVLSAVCLN